MSEPLYEHPLYVLLGMLWQWYVRNLFWCVSAPYEFLGQQVDNLLVPPVIVGPDHVKPEVVQFRAWSTTVEEVVDFLEASSPVVDEFLSCGYAENVVEYFASKRLRAVSSLYHYRTNVLTSC
jgi:hypothetical protein